MNKEILARHAALFATVQAWDNGGLTMDRYAIAIGDDIWFMSEYPTQVNEVCMYGGTRKEYQYIHLGEPIALAELPVEVLKQIIALGG